MKWDFSNKIMTWCNHHIVVCLLHTIHFPILKYTVIGLFFLISYLLYQHHIHAIIVKDLWLCLVQYQLHIRSIYMSHAIQFNSQYKCINVTFPRANIITWPFHNQLKIKGLSPLTIWTAMTLVYVYTTVLTGSK